MLFLHSSNNKASKSSLGKQPPSFLAGVFAAWSVSSKSLMLTNWHKRRLKTSYTWAKPLCPGPAPKRRCFLKSLKLYLAYGAMLACFVLLSGPWCSLDAAKMMAGQALAQGGHETCGSSSRLQLRMLPDLAIGIWWLLGWDAAARRR